MIWCGGWVGGWVERRRGSEMVCVCVLVLVWVWVWVVGGEWWVGWFVGWLGGWVGGVWVWAARMRMHRTRPATPSQKLVKIGPKQPAHIHSRGRV